MKFAIVLVVVAIAIVATATEAAHASTLSLEAPPPPNVPINGSYVNLTADDNDRDISIDPLDSLPANGTQTIKTIGATDIDINDFPPVGISVLIQNDTITVTNQTVTLGNTFGAEALESNDD